MNDRIAAFRRRYVNTDPGVCPERAEIYTRIYREHPDKPLIIRRAIAFTTVLREMTIYIDPEAILAGNQASAPRCAPVCPEYACRWLQAELDQLALRPSDRFLISDDTKRRLRAVLPYWEGKTQQDRAWSVQPEAVLQDMKVGVLGWEGNITAGEGHIIPDYEAIVQQGLPAFADRIRSLNDGLRLHEPEDLRRLYFYRASDIVIRGLLDYIGRYAQLARSQAESEQDANRRRELNEMADRCAQLRQGPPRSFLEALQLVWFVHVALHIESNGHSLSLGRIDQYLYPFYARDLAAGRLTPDAAEEAVGCLYIKIFGNIKLRSWGSTCAQLGYPTYQNICLGGQNADGSDATNPLSHLFLDVLAQTRLSEPNVYIRVHPGTPDSFMHKAVQVLKIGFGMPAMVNDEVIIPSLMDRGVSREDAVGYSTFGCAEVQVPGKWGYRANGKCKVNMLKILEISLNGGVDPRTGIKTFFGAKPLAQCATFDEVLSSYEATLKHYMDLQVAADNINDMIMEEMTPDAMIPIFVNDCLARGKTIKQGGAVYDIISGCLVGIPNVGNALYAIQEWVYRRREISPEALMRALDANFQGPENEAIRHLLFAGADKYGNDSDEVDDMVVRTSDFYFKNIFNYRNMRHGLGPIGGNFTSSTVTISTNVSSGKVVGATADGRYAGEPTCDGVSPMHKTQYQGPTAVFNSVTKLSTRDVSGGQLLNMRFQPQLLNTPEKEAKFIAMIRGYFRREGWHVQFNMISNDILRDAQRHPENYRDLVVRVAGYSALFTALDTQTQNDIINRTEFEI